MKKGDLVVCTDPTSMELYLKKGHLYIVTDADNTWCRVRANSPDDDNKLCNTPWYNWRFTKIEV